MNSPSLQLRTHPRRKAPAASANTRTSKECVCVVTGASPLVDGIRTSELHNTQTLPNTPHHQLIHPFTRHFRPV